MAGGKSLGVLTLDLLVKTASFVEGLGKGERETKKFSTAVSKNMKAAAGAFTGLVAGATAATGILIKNSINLAASLDDISQTTGVAVEDLSALKYAAEFEGIAFENLATSMGKFSKTAFAAANGSKAAAESFKALGIEVKNSDGTLKETDELLLQVAERFAGMEDGIAKANYAQALFGKSGATLIPFLNKGRDGIQQLTDEAERFGLIVSSQTASAADDFNDNLFRLKSIITGTGLSLAEQLLPKMVEFTDLIQDPATQSGIAAIVNGIVDIGTVAVKATAGLAGLGKMIGETLAKQINGAAFGDLNALQDQLKEIESDMLRLNKQTSLNPNEQKRLDNLYKQHNEIEELIRLTEELYKPQSSSAAPASPPPPPPAAFILEDTAGLEEAARLQEVIDKRIASMREEVILNGEIGAAEQARYDIANGELKGLSAIDEVTILGLAEQKDANEALQKSIEDRKKAQLDKEEEAKQFEAVLAALDREVELYGEVTRAEAALYDISVGNLKSLTAEQAALYLEKQKALDQLDAAAKAEEAHQKQLEKDAKVFEEFTLEAARNVQNALSDAFMGVESSWGDTLRKMAADFTSSALLKAVSSFLTKSSSPALQAIGGVFAGTFANGGMIPAGEWGIAGETGPEIVQGPAFVTSQKKTEGLLRGASNTNFNFDLSGIRDASEAQQASSTVKRAVLAGIKDAGRYG